MEAIDSFGVVISNKYVFSYIYTIMATHCSILGASLVAQ